MFAEDLSSLKIRIEQAVREFEATGIPARACTEEPLEITDKAMAHQFSERLLRIQTSNSVRTQLLKHTNFDIPTFENLLLSAENIRYRRDLGRKYGQKDDLVDGLRRIYSTIACTVPVSLSEQDWIEQPAQLHMITYGTGPFYPYSLPGRPEFFDHDSISTTRSSEKGCTGIQMSEHQNLLSQEYWRNLYHEMTQTIAAQRMDEVGSAKLKKNPDCMNRDWDQFYNPIYKTGMANYATAAAQRIESEANEELLKEARAKQNMEEVDERLVSGAQRTITEDPIQSQRSCFVESLQSDSRRSSADCTDSSEATTKLDVGNQDNKKHTLLCLYVNKLGGCSDRSQCGAESHSNEGKHCRWADQCKFGAGRCAYIHDAPSGIGPVHPASPRVSNSAASVPQRTTDLRPVLSQVLANPKAFKVCGYVNKHQGCKSGMGCAFNHTLEGVVCKDYRRGQCARDFECPLRHIQDFGAIAGPSIYAPYSSERLRGKSSRDHHNTFLLPPIPQNFDSHHKTPIAPVTDHELRPNNAHFGRLDSDAQWPDLMDYQQSAQDRGLPPNTPTGPRSQYAQPPNIQLPYSKHDDNYGASYHNESHQNNLKRKEPYDQPRGNGRPLVDQVTRDETFQEQHDNGSERDYRDYSGDDENDMMAMQEVHLPRKKQKKGRKWHGLQEKKDRGGGHGG